MMDADDHCLGSDLAGHLEDLVGDVGADRLTQPDVDGGRGETPFQFSATPFSDVLLVDQRIAPRRVDDDQPGASPLCLSSASPSAASPYSLGM